MPYEIFETYFEYIDLQNPGDRNRSNYDLVSS